MFLYETHKQTYIQFNKDIYISQTQDIPGKNNLKIHLTIIHNSFVNLSASLCACVDP